MPIKASFLRIAALLLLVNSPVVGRSQTSEPTLENFVSQSVIEAKNLGVPTIAEWAILHPGEIVESPADKDRNYDPENARQRHNRELEGRWCLRSTAEIKLTGGLRVHRVALFYQPLVEDIYDKPLPPLPAEDGEALRRHGCRLVKILYEFDGVADPQNAAEAIAKIIPGKRSEEPGRFIVNVGEDYWRPAFSFVNHSFCFLFIRDPEVGASAGIPVNQQPAVLLEWEGEILKYGSPSKKTINPEAGQPWIPMRAALLAGLPKVPSLNMLSYLTPQVGDQWKQPPFHCHKQLVPVLRKWMNLAAQSAPEQHAAALLLANEVLDRLSECEEFSDSNDYVPPEEEDAEAGTYDALKKELKELGIDTEKSARPGPEYYAGNLFQQIRKLVPSGPVNELYRMAVLDGRCQWSQITEMDCNDLIKQGESFLSIFPEDEWTPSVHLILAEAYSMTAADLGDSYTAAPDFTKAELLKKAAAHYRAWYAKSANQGDRALVWEEIWAIEADIGPWLNLPWVYQQ